MGVGRRQVREQWMMWPAGSHSERWLVVGLIIAGCGASVPEAVHHQRIVEQREGYEERLFAAERARLDCEADAKRARETAQAQVSSLAQRVERLERAAVRARPARAKGAGNGGLLATVRQALQVSDVIQGAKGEVQWQSSVADWFDSGSSQLRPDVIPRLSNLARLLAERGRLTLEVRLMRPPSGATEALDTGWREVTQRGVAILTALQAQGIAAARLTLAIGGAAPEGRIVFSIQRRAQRRR